MDWRDLPDPSRMDWRDPSHLYGERSRYRGPVSDDERIYREDARARVPGGPMDRGGHRERNIIRRARDEVRSWLGDEEAERRRRDDERHGRFDEVRAHGVMSREVISVHPADSIERAARLMAECDCGALPVVDDRGRLLGMVTDRDITVRVAARGWNARRAQVEDAMTHEAFAGRPDDRVVDCMRQMSRHQVRRVPIVDRFDRAVGVLSQGDLARHAGIAHEPIEREAMSDVLYAISEPTHVAHR